MTVQIGRAYSLLTLKAVDEANGRRILTGMATTPSVDRVGDTINPLGVKFAAQMPFLWQHRHDQPIGWVKFGKPTKDGIPFEAEVAVVDEPGTLKDRVDEAWQSIKLKLVRAVSIGFRPLKWAWIGEYDGIDYQEIECFELSAVTIPANVDAVIAQVSGAKDAAAALVILKTFDQGAPAETGRPSRPDFDPSPGDPGKKQAAVVAVSKTPKEGKMPKTIADQVRDFEITRETKAARMVEIMTKSGEDGVTLDQAETEEYDTLKGEVEAVDKHLVRLREMEGLNLTKATPISPVADLKTASEQRGGHHIVVPRAKELAKGLGFTRFAIALARSKGNLMQAEAMASGNEQWKAETPDVLAVLKAAVAAGTTTDSTWAAPLVQYQNLASEFIEYLRPLTIIGRMKMRNVPFKVKMPRQTGASSANWVGEGKVKPVSKLAFDSITLDFAKIAGIVVLTDELVRHSSPSAETIVRDDLAATIIQFMDSQFVDPTKAADDVSPASVTYGVTPVTATGTTLDALQDDVFTLMSTFVDSNLSVADAVWIMTQQQALGISLMRNALGQKQYPDINVNGGMFEGLPVIASENLPGTGGSPTDGYPLILAKQSDILLADDGQVTLDASREASLQMDSAPDSPATGSTTLVSLWQHNMIGLRAEREINWKKRRDEAVGFIQNAKYRP